MVSNMHRLLLRERRNNRSNSDFQTFFEEFLFFIPNPLKSDLPLTSYVMFCEGMSVQISLVYGFCVQNEWQSVFSCFFSLQSISFILNHYVNVDKNEQSKSQKINNN